MGGAALLHLQTQPAQAIDVGEQVLLGVELPAGHAQVVVLAGLEHQPLLLLVHAQRHDPAVLAAADLEAHQVDREALPAVEVADTEHGVTEIGQSCHR